MARARLRKDEAEVWDRVRAFAEARAEDGGRVFTLQDGVANTIVAVEGAKIIRASTQPRKDLKNSTPIYRGELLRVWNDLVERGATSEARPNYFTLALLQAALPDLIEDLGDGTIALRGRRLAVGDDEPDRDRSPAPPRAYSQTASENQRPSVSADHQPPRESEAHWAIKHFIRDQPDRALVGLAGGPWLASALELPLRVPTRDTIDVVVRDLSDGRRVLIEVKPTVTATSVGLYAQAAKYRAIWRVLHDLGPGQVRCALAAPEIPAALAAQMLERHAIESVAVAVPPDYEPPPRPA